MCCVSTNVCVVPGGTVSEGCPIGMGAAVVGQREHGMGRCRDVLAKPLKISVEGGAYLRRSGSVVGLRVQGGLEHPWSHA
jgi:hypothetical protein